MKAKFILATFLIILALILAYSLEALATHIPGHGDDGPLAPPPVGGGGGERITPPLNPPIGPAAGEDRQGTGGQPRGGGGGAPGAGGAQQPEVNPEGVLSRQIRRQTNFIDTDGDGLPDQVVTTSQITERYNDGTTRTFTQTDQQFYDPERGRPFGGNLSAFSITVVDPQDPNQPRITQWRVPRYDENGTLVGWQAVVQSELNGTAQWQFIDNTITDRNVYGSTDEAEEQRTLTEQEANQIVNQWEREFGEPTRL